MGIELSFILNSNNFFGATWGGETLVRVRVFKIMSLFLKQISYKLKLLPSAGEMRPEKLANSHLSTESGKHIHTKEIKNYDFIEKQRQWCVCVCVCVRQTDRQTDRQRASCSSLVLYSDSFPFLYISLPCCFVNCGGF